MKKYNIDNRRYIGSKNKLLDWIFENIKKHTNGNSFLDIFSGTGIVSARATKYYRKIIMNDFLHSNEIIYNAFFKENSVNYEKLKNIIELYNNIDSNEIEDNYFSINFGNKYFGYNDSKKIGYIRENIDNLVENNEINFEEKNALIASLIYSIDKIANTVGHYEAYIKKEVKDNKLELGIINKLNLKNEIEIYREDANILATQIKADIVFIDPPYNSRQYSRFYHILENIVKWEKPELFGVALKPKEENMSLYCRSEAPKIFDELIKSLNCKYIVVTYNNTYNSKSSSSKNKISFDEILDSLNSVGKTKIFEKKHNYFNAGKTEFNNHKEYLFITEVNDEF